MKILITGGAGFIGSNLIQSLKNNTTHEITSLDNYFTGSINNHIQGVCYIHDNVLNIASIPKQDVVFHLGEYSRVVPSFKDIEYLIQTNLYATSVVIEQCKKWGAKLIYSASSSKFGGNENLSPYSWVKSKMVELILNYQKWYGLRYEICYFYNVYGDRQILSGDYATVIGIFERLYKEGKPLTIYGDGNQVRHFTHVNDLTNALLKVMTKNTNRNWYLSSEQEYSINEVADLFKHHKIYKPKNIGERVNAVIPENSTKRDLDWSIKYDLKDWINDIINEQK